MTKLDLSDEEREALTRHLREHIEGTRYPLSPALRPLRSVLAKLDPQSVPAPIASVAGRYPVPSSLARRKRR